MLAASRCLLLTLAVGALAPAVSGCGSVYYAAQINAAQTRVEHARSVGAAQYAPYEYYFAEEHLKKAKTEAGEASYSDAATFAEVAEEYAQKAIDIAKAQKK